MDEKVTAILLRERVNQLGDDVAINATEVAALIGVAPITVQQRRVRGLPPPLPHTRRLRWRLGAIRAWLRNV